MIVSNQHFLKELFPELPPVTHKQAEGVKCGIMGLEWEWEVWGYLGSIRIQGAFLKYSWYMRLSRSVLGFGHVYVEGLL